MTAKRKNRRTALTLLEMILAIVLLSVILLTAASLELGVRRLYSSTDAEVHFLSEISYIMIKISKDVSTAVGCLDLSAWDTTDLPNCDTTFRMRFDTNYFVPGPDSMDVWCAYCFNNSSGTSGHELRYYPDAREAEYQVLSKNVVGFTIYAPYPNGTSFINITLRRLPDEEPSYTNPEFNLCSFVTFRQYSVR